MLIVFLLVLVFPNSLVADGFYKMSVSGWTTCNGQVMPYANVQLYEYDLLTPNDLLDTSVSNSRGEFFVSGLEGEVLTVPSFYILVTHTCNAKPNCKLTSMFDMHTIDYLMKGMINNKQLPLDDRSLVKSEQC